MILRVRCDDEPPLRSLFVSISTQPLCAFDYIQTNASNRPPAGGEGPGETSRDPPTESAGHPRYFSQGPVMARVMPGTWMLTNRTLPSGENVGPVNSEYVGAPLAVPLLSWLRAIA